MQVYEGNASGTKEIGTEKTPGTPRESEETEWPALPEREKTPRDDNSTNAKRARTPEEEVDEEEESLLPTTRPRMSYADRVRSSFLLELRHRAPGFELLTNEEFREAIEIIEDRIFSEGGVNPAIDWVSWKEGRSMIACADRPTVEWVKETLGEIDSQYGAWLPNEGPLELKRFVLRVPYPTAKRAPDDILARVVDGNGLEGRMKILKGRRTDRALILIMGADERMRETLIQRGNRVRCGVTKLDMRELVEGDNRCFKCEEDGHFARECPHTGMAIKKCQCQRGFQFWSALRSWQDHRPEGKQTTCPGGGGSGERHWGRRRGGRRGSDGSVEVRNQEEFLSRRFPGRTNAK